MTEPSAQPHGPDPIDPLNALGEAARAPVRARHPDNPAKSHYRTSTSGALGRTVPPPEPCPALDTSAPLG